MWWNNVSKPLCASKLNVKSNASEHHYDFNDPFVGYLLKFLDESQVTDTESQKSK